MIGIIAAPSNLGLRPPQPGSVPGTAKAPEALREAGLHRRLIAAGASEHGVVLPSRYVDDADPTAGRVRNSDALVDHARRLADRVGRLLDEGIAPLVLGGDCSLLVGSGVALKRRGAYGLAHLDGHTDFRHPGNSPVCLSVAVRTSRRRSDGTGRPSPTSTGSVPTSTRPTRSTSAAGTTTST